MTLDALERNVRAAVGSAIEFEPMREDAARVHVPFVFADGDQLVIRLRWSPDGALEWTDFGHTYMHLSYALDLDTLDSGPRAAIVESALRRFNIEDRSGELVKPTTETRAGTDLYLFCQGLIEIADLRTHTQAKIASTFRADLDTLITAEFGARVRSRWHDEHRDPAGNYRIDYLINGLPRPIALFGIANDAQASSATIALLKLREWGVDMFSTAVQADPKSLSTVASARLMDAVDKQWSALAGHEDAIVSYIHREIERQSR